MNPSIETRQDSQMTWTEFIGTSNVRCVGAWSDLATRMTAAGTYRNAAQQPRIKLAVFVGDVQTVYGVEADVEGVTVEDARHRLQAHGIRALVYGTVSAAQPTCHVIAPFSKGYNASRRFAFVGVLNGALGRRDEFGGFVTDSSFGHDHMCAMGSRTSKGHVAGCTYDDADAGQCIDRLTDLHQRDFLIGRRKPSAKPSPPAQPDLVDHRLLEMTHSLYAGGVWLPHSPNAPLAGSYARLKAAPGFPGLDKRQTLARLAGLQHGGWLFAETYRNGYRHVRRRWALTEAALTLIAHAPGAVELTASTSTAAQTAAVDALRLEPIRCALQ